MYANRKKSISEIKGSGEEIFQTDEISRNTNWDAGAEKIIKKNILIGNFDGAIDSAAKCGRWVEALLLSHSKGEEKFLATMESYFLSRKDVFIKNTLRNVVERKFENLVHFYDLAAWRELVVLLITNAPPHLVPSLYEKIAQRFTQ